jgi:thiol-disulfide isomerase/thioredoxin
MTDSNLPQRSGTLFSRRLAVGAGAVLLTGAAVLYGIIGGGGKETSAACTAAAKTAEKIAPLAQGGLAALTIPKAPRAAVDVTFDGPSGEKKTLADFRGKTVLLNLWATWCIPCREEMPALDKLQAKLGGSDFEVVAVSIDTARLERRKAFLEEAGIEKLAFYADSSADIFQRLKRAGKVTGLPTTLLIDRSGCEIGVLAGPADWASDEAIKLISLAKAN